MASEYAISKQTLTGIADAIREKTQTSDTMTPGQMPSKIRSINGGGSGGVQSVEVTQIQSTGTKIASIDVDGTSTDLYAPNGGGGGSAVSITPVLQSGTKIATATVDGASTDLYAPAQADISGKADKVANATSGHFAALDSNGNLTDSGHQHSDYLTQHQDISGKADKVANATNGHFAALDSNGNLTDSGHQHSDYLTQHQDISGKLDAPSTAGTSGQVLKLDANLEPVWADVADAAAREDIAEIESSLNAAPTEATIAGVLDEIEAGNEILSSIQEGIQPLTDGVPDYFRANLNSALAAYKTNAEEVGVDGGSCIFITDTHWGSNQKHSPNLIRWLVNHSNLRNVFCGGDILDTSSIANEMRKGYDFIERFADIPGGLKTVIGNHDYNKNNHTEQPEYWLSKAQVYSLFYPKAEMEIHDFQCLEPGEGYYEFSFYVDVPATNTRYLFVSIPFGSVYTVTKDWVMDQLTNNPTKNFVLISHYLYNASSGTYPGGASGLIYNIKGFSNLKAWLFGHTHEDLVLYTSTGIPLVCTDTDSSRISANNPNGYTIGTITEQAFDIVTVNHTNRNVECARVGRGKNRRINGGLNAVGVSETLTLTPAITPTAWQSSDTSVATISNGVVTGVAAGQATIKAVSDDKEEYWCVSVT